MTIHLVTFATKDMSRSAVLCANSAEKHGADFQWLYTPNTIQQTEFYRNNKQLLEQPRGFGYFVWKPFIVHSLMVNVTESYLLKDGDVIIYADAGIEFINNVYYIIDRMDQDIFLFGNNWEHAHWCKRDVVEAIIPLKCGRCHGSGEVEGYGGNNIYCGLCAGTGKTSIGEEAWLQFGKQVQASVIFFRVSDYSRKFVKEWLDWCLFEGGRLIDDSPSRTPNHPEFREHRHDQAILTTMAYRDGLKLHYWPAMYNDGAFTYEKLPEYAGDNYPILFHHHRRRNIDWEQGRNRFNFTARAQTVRS